MSKKPAASRLYFACEKEGEKPLALIDTHSVAQARAYLSEKTTTIRYASQADIIVATKAGIVPESAATPAAPVAE